MEIETKRILETCIEAASEIIDVNLDEQIKQVGLGFQMTKQDTGDYLVEFGLPNNTEMKAFVLTLRMFTQQTESFSFPNIHGLFRDKGLSKEFKEGVIAIRRAYFDYLKSHSTYTVELFEGHPTRGEILDTVMYGSKLAHMNDQNTIQRFKNWSRDEIRAGLLMQEFSSILLQILVFIRSLSELCEMELENQNA